MNSYYVINFNCNKKTFEPYDVIPYLKEAYKQLKKNKSLQKVYPLPTSFKDFKIFVERESRHQFWGRCEYEVILVDWPCQEIEKKWDVYEQIHMNLDSVTCVLMEALKLK